VINALTDLEHPCQALADFLTMLEVHGDLPGQTLAYIGDGNNVAHSLMLCGALLGVNVRIGCPEGFEPLSGVLDQARSLAQHGASIDICTDPVKTVAGAQAVYTDVWASMGQEDEQAEREAAFASFCVDQALMDHAAKDAIALHCLPAHRGEEITAEVLEGASSRIFDQAENRLHAQQALLAALMGGL
jgi:ornithine carbamoyltransferase